ncbi:alpha/beta hydrolase [Afifella sp. JA880]|uniref:alpha/beta hydrolase n=1 Tax=Afifella sp. JA880 TaxID=2975280 RepID=UPI0021BAACDA|nr:alpha/beta hydrolase [Afifella sp. JA880]MCT8266923.1 alpha/beta hydrolase [Afifella sp. JA880]
MLSLSYLWQDAALRFADLTSPKRGYQRISDIAYGVGPRHKLDLYKSESPRENTPLVVFFYGGGWDSGRKADYRFIAQAFTTLGCDVAIPDYRLYPDVHFPQFVEDGAKAVAFLASGKADGLRRPVFLAGHSAGAQIAFLLTLDGRYLAKAGSAVETAVQGAIGLAGPYDFLPLEEERYKRVFPLETRAASQPIAFVEGPTPPVFLATGTADRTVDPANSERLARKLRSFGNENVTHVVYPKIGHAELIGTLLPLLQRRAPLLADLGDFIEAYSQPPTPSPEPVREAVPTM